MSEINIIEIVKSWRYYESALRYLLPEKQRLDFKERSRYIAIDPDEDAKSQSMKAAIALQAKRAKSIRRLDFSDGFFSSDDDDEMEQSKE